MLRLCVLFFFQAEDGIRDVAVTGVQTCALPPRGGGSGAGDRAYGGLAGDRREPPRWGSSRRGGLLYRWPSGAARGGRGGGARRGGAERAAARRGAPADGAGREGRGGRRPPGLGRRGGPAAA